MLTNFLIKSRHKLTNFANKFAERKDKGDSDIIIKIGFIIVAVALIIIFKDQLLAIINTTFTRVSALVQTLFN